MADGGGPLLGGGTIDAMGEQIVAGADETGDVWPASLKAWEQHACAVAGRSFTREEWRRFVGNRAYVKTCG